MSRRPVAGAGAHLAPLPPPPPPPPSNCAKFLYYSWKLCSVVFSHLVMISLVVAYCILGAVTFEKLEADHEREVKRNISQIRHNTTQSIWSMTRSVPLLNQTNWTCEVVTMLKEFESSILLEMKMRGWDGSESTDHIQWTFTGALFYSIIVITTIGYGHIAPKTQSGKVVTIFYAILGIPLMLLCLSNIGDVMASSFRFLYWRVCCYVCTRPPKRRRQRHASVRRSVRGRGGSTRRRKTAALPPPPPPPPPLERAHSDTDFRYRDSGYSSSRGRRARPPPHPPPSHAHPAPPPHRTASQPPSHHYGREVDPEDRSPVRYERDEYYEEDKEDFPKISLPLQDLAAALKDLDEHQDKYTKIESRSKSLPRPAKLPPDYGARREWDSVKRNGVGDRDNDTFQMHDLHDVDYENFKERKALEERDKRRLRSNEDEYEGYRDRGYDPEDDDYDFDAPRYRRTMDDRRGHRGRSEYVERPGPEYSSWRQRERRARSAVYDYGHRWEDGREMERERDGRWTDVEGGRPRRLRRLDTIDNTRRGFNDRYTPSPDRDEWSDEEALPPRRVRGSVWNSRQMELYPVVPEPPLKEEIKPVPIWLCVFLVASYIVAGTFLFKRWEGWAYLDAAYFCFITLTTIGFGDFVPAQSEVGGTGAGGGMAGVSDAAAAVHSIALCSLYLLFGIALLAMSFNLVQEEVRANVSHLAIRLGIIKPRRPEHEDDTSDY